MDLPARFDRALAVLIPNISGPVALAISGGGDSMALMHMAAQSKHLGASELHAFTVDHGLRNEAAEEARLVENQASILGISHTTLTWQTPNASQARAREARHRLLASAAISVGAKLLVTGHTQSDNTESFLIRARAGSGWYGLSGMGELTVSPVWPEGAGVYIARPMLSFDRTEIRAWLRSSELSWCDDPSNEKAAYERVRMRRMQNEAPGLSQRIARIQKKLGYLRGARDRQLASILACAKWQDDELVIELESEMNSETLSQILSLVAMAVAGTDTPARTERCRNAAQRLLSEDSNRVPIVLTLGGSIIRKSGQTLAFHRESNRPGAVPPGETSSRLRHICAGLTGAPPA